jgi:cellulose synthase/poly-beta-1,6-N-acetylglucosamine synthase-like glycosyltransferase
MVFRRDVLEQHPWEAHSIAEDVEYTLRLIKSGIKVSFVDEVKVFSQFPDRKDQLQVQRMRWARNLGFSKRQALKLIWEGIVQGRGLLTDAGWTLLVLSRPLVLIELFIAVILGSFSVWLLPGQLSKGLFAAGLIVLLVQLLYFALGVALLGVNVRRMKLLLSSPVTVGRLIVISLSGVFGVRGNIWSRTPR